MKQLPKATYSQLGQDVFVLDHFGYKMHGFFVEFGATDGIRFSNTYKLELDYEWDGILAEPAKCWHEALRANRTAHICTDCVWSQTGYTIPFSEALVPEYSTAQSHIHADHHANQRANARTYEVQTISLLDLLKKFDAPKEIQYLSLDTEGSELEILKAFDWTQYDIELITVEHNYTPQREAIFNLLKSKGFERVLTDESKWDDWYVKRNKL